MIRRKRKKNERGGWCDFLIMMKEALTNFNGFDPIVQRAGGDEARCENRIELGIVILCEFTYVFRIAVLMPLRASQAAAIDVPRIVSELQKSLSSKADRCAEMFRSLVEANPVLKKFASVSSQFNEFCLHTGNEVVQESSVVHETHSNHTTSQRNG